MRFALLTERIGQPPLVEAVDSAQWVKLASLRKALRELGAREEHIDVLGSSYFRLSDGRRLRVSDHGAMHSWSHADLYASIQQDYHRGESLKEKVFELWKHDDWGKAIKSFLAQKKL